MSGQVKKILAILAVLGITAGGTVQFLGNVMKLFPESKVVQAICTILVTVIGVLVAYYDVSVKDPNAKNKLQ